MISFEERKPGLIEKAKTLDGNKAKELLAGIIESIMTDTAGNINNPFAYMSQRDWLSIEEEIVNASP